MPTSHPIHRPSAHAWPQPAGRTSLLWAASGLALALSLSACGGGGGGGGSGGGIHPSPDPLPVDRIEAYDPSASGRSLAQIRQHPVVHAAFIGQAHPHAHEIRLPAWAELRSLLQAQAEPDQALPVGRRRDLAATADSATTAALWPWQQDPDGSQRAVLRFVAEDAQGLRLGLRIEALPSGSQLRFYNGQGQLYAELSAQDWAQKLAQQQAQGLSPEQAQWYWSPDSGDAQSSLEVWLPAGQSPSQLRLAVPALSHLAYARGQAPDSAQVRSNASCKRDAICYPQQSAQSRAVARLRFVEGGNTYECTGTLLNNSANDGKAYFLTARHCISNARTANTVETTWFFTSAACNSNTTSRQSTTVSGGADLLKSHDASDSTLLQLRGQLPTGVLYAGSYFGSPAPTGTAVYSLHHLLGLPLSLSQGRVSGYANCSLQNNAGSCPGAQASSGQHWTVTWQEGVTDQGSSGGPLLRSLAGKDYVIGQLTAGNSSCSTPNAADFYGRLDQAMQAGMKQWLLPNTR